MPHLILELALWTLFAFFLGCIVGCILRKLFAAGETEALRDVSAQGTTASTVVPVEGATVPATIDTPAQPERPKGIAAARDSKPDNLQRIAGIGPSHERTLQNLGFFHFDQIAAWTPAEVAWVDDHLKFDGRIEREEWITQARLLAEGKDEEFERRFGAGRPKTT
jgi:NADH-quinone oxidoreductase subunit E